ncbi:hypothetical protein [Metabacillus halosaccharovorans]|uniref:hypothetical protein n=1 Tax=Metabacillus halosaccharovorans TaxID=930124 RepID=UPI002040BA19|nr:hypothetical protein [Metabacillus halosaccharovorans]MCM3442877.1 hypothetical protein [Metabacillus halosaccharovorans]
MQLNFDHQYDATLEYAKQLPSFDNIYAAQAFYYEFRQEHLHLLMEIANEYHVTLDYSKNSLISLEHLYFSLFQNNSFFDSQVTIEEFETSMGIYMCDVLVKQHPNKAEWLVEAYAYGDDKYVMGIRYGRYNQYFQNLLHQFYLMNKDAGKQELVRRYERMEKRCI